MGCSGKQAQNANSSVADDRPGEKLNFKIIGGRTAPDDQGNANVKIEAELEETAKSIRIKGKTNLMPGAKLEAVVETSLG